MSAVQHERGPRKPKYRDHSELKVLHSPIALTASPFTKAITALERHNSHTQQSAHHQHNHQHNIMNKIPPLISNNSNTDRTELLSGIFANKGDACHLGSLSANTMGSTGGPFFDGLPTAPPGLLQMLLNAEKSQELIWNSIRSGAVMGSLHSNNLPFGMSRIFDEVSPHTTSLFFPPFLSTGGACNLLPTPIPPSQSTTPSSSNTSNESHTPDSERKSISRNSFNGLPFPKPLQQLSATGQWDSVHEVTARLLFMVIRWVKCLPTYRTLTKNDQVFGLFG